MIPDDDSTFGDIEGESKKAKEWRKKQAMSTRESNKNKEVGEERDSHVYT